MSPHIACLLGAFALLTACKTTPLDVVYATDVGAVGDGGASAEAGAAAGGGAGNGGGGAASGGASAGAAGHCSTSGPASYVLRSRPSGTCLGQGAATSIFGNPAYTLDFSELCRGQERAWQLLPTAVPNVFSLQNMSAPGYVLDVQMALTRDGTPVLTYAVTGFDNQHFEVRPRDTFASELRPQHHPQSCLSATATSAQITTCDAADSSQDWLLQRSNDCL